MPLTITCDECERVRGNRLWVQRREPGGEIIFVHVRDFLSRWICVDSDRYACTMKCARAIRTKIKRAESAAKAAGLTEEAKAEEPK